jgi:predicted NBD/HSP70 family sugar kinase
VRLAVVSAADPVDRKTGRLVHLPDAPFLLGDLAPAEVLDELVEGPVLIDNDVNWAARAERAAAGVGLDDFAYLYLGEGLGCAVVNDGIVRRGHAGLVGEIAHVITIGPGDRAIPFTEVFDSLGLRQPGSTAIDNEALLATIRGDDRDGRHALATVSRATCGVLAALVALADPELVVIGGTWGRSPVVLDAVATRFADLPRHVPIRAARLSEQASLTGARAQALDALRADITKLS